MKQPFKDRAGIATVFVQVDRPEQFEEAFATVRREQADALYVAGGRF
jgi:CO/xanthine dehydrogenase FAD-binding subunit